MQHARIWLSADSNGITLDLNVFLVISTDLQITSGQNMKITDKERALIDEWIAEHREIEKLEEELGLRATELKKISNKLYTKNSKKELEEFRDFLNGEINKLDKTIAGDRIKQLSNLKTIVEHDINIENLVEQDIDIEEQGVNIDLKDYNE